MSKVILAVCLLTASVVARAQTAAPPAPPPPVPPVPPTPAIAPLPPVFPFGGGDDVMMFVSSELGGRSVIKGAPYAATAVNETRQVLNDGNRIERSSSTRLYRDSQGRTRQEQAGGAVFINDVVAGKGYVLNPQRQSARELRISHRLQAPPAPPVPPGTHRAAGRSHACAAAAAQAALANERGGGALMGRRHAALGA